MFHMEHSSPTGYGWPLRKTHQTPSNQIISYFTAGSCSSGSVSFSCQPCCQVLRCFKQLGVQIGGRGCCLASAGNSGITGGGTETLVGCVQQAISATDNSSSVRINLVDFIAGLLAQVIDLQLEGPLYRLGLLLGSCGGSVVGVAQAEEIQVSLGRAHIPGCPCTDAGPGRQGGEDSDNHHAQVDHHAANTLSARLMRFLRSSMPFRPPLIFLVCAMMSLDRLLSLCFFQYQAADSAAYRGSSRS